MKPLLAITTDEVSMEASVQSCPDVTPSYNKLRQSFAVGWQPVFGGSDMGRWRKQRLYEKTGTIILQYEIVRT